MQRIEGIMRDYAWGSQTALADLTGQAPTGHPQAEIWFGTHPAAPSLLADHRPRTLADLIAEDPQQHLGKGQEQLPFLLKLLAADRALSIQVHPTKQQAEQGYAQEDAAGIPLDSPQRNYKDRNHKPELLVALTPFTALAGFRPVDRTRELFAALGCAHLFDAEAALPDTLSRCLNLSSEQTQAAIIALVRGARALLADDATSAAERTQTPERWMHEVAELLLELAKEYPGDPGILSAALLNLVVLEPGEALYLDAGQLHAYVDGCGVEIMANSDNVLRGGLTQKHIDVAELLNIVRYEPIEDPRLLVEADGTYSVPAEEFVLRRVDDGKQECTGPAMILAVGPDVLVDGTSIVPGEAAWVGAGETVSLDAGAVRRASQGARYDRYGVFIAQPGQLN